MQLDEEAFAAVTAEDPDLYEELLSVGAERVALAEMFEVTDSATDHTAELC